MTSPTLADGTTPTWAALAGFEFVLLIFFTLGLVRHYASKGTPWYAVSLVFVSWYLGFFGTLFLPIDIAEAYYASYLNVTNVTSFAVGPAPSFSASPSASASASTSALPPASPSPSPSPSFSASGTGSPSLPASASATSTYNWASFTRTATSLPASLTPTASLSPSPTPTATVTPAASASRTPTPSKSVSASASLVPPSQSRSPSHSYVYTPSSSETPIGTCVYCSERRRALDGGVGGGDGDGASSADTGALFGVASRWLARSLLAGGSWRHAEAALDAPLLLRHRPPPLQPLLLEVRRLQANASVPANTSYVIGWDMQTTAVPLRNPQLESMWVAVYWLTFFLTYILIPIVQEYVAAGEFTKRGRLLASLQINIIFYAVCGVVAFGALAYVIVYMNQGLSDLTPVLIGLANTMGLVIIILLLGYGTAEVPRAIWNESDAPSYLRRLYFHAPELDAVLFDARGTLTDLLKRVREFEEQLALMAADRQLAEKSPRRAALVPELQRCLAVVNRKVVMAQLMLGPGAGAKKKETAEQARRRAALEKKFADEHADEEEEAKAAAGGGSWFGGLPGMGKSDKYKAVSLPQLAKLHKRLMREIAAMRKAQFRLDALVTRCMLLEHVVAGVAPPVPIKRKTAEGKTFYITPKGAGLDATVVANVSAAHPVARQARQTVFDSKALAAGGGGMGADAGMDVLSERAGEALLDMLFLPHLFDGALNRASWTFRILAVPYVYKVLWLLCELLSLLLLWSEATIFLNLTGLVPVNLSIFGWFLQWAVQGAHSYAAIQLAALFPLAYMCLCSTYSVFSLKLFGMMDLSGNQNTDPYSLLVCASLFNRLQFALAFNYLNVLMHSANRQDYPPTAFLTSIGARMDLSVVDWYLPLGMVVIYAMCKASVFNRLLTLIGVEELGDPASGNIEHDGVIRTGMAVVSKGKRTLGLVANPDGMSDEDFDRADEASRDRLKAIMLRVQARKEGRDPDAAARPDGGDTGSGAAAARAEGTGSHYASGGAAFGVAGMSMTDFSALKVGAGGGGSGGGGSGVGAPGKAGGGGLAALAAKAGMGALHSITGGALQQQQSTARAGSAAAARLGATIDHGDDVDVDINGAFPASARDRADADEWGSRGTATADFSRAQSSTGAAVEPVSQEPPTMAELLKGKRRLA